MTISHTVWTRSLWKRQTDRWGDDELLMCTRFISGLMSKMWIADIHGWLRVFSLMVADIYVHVCNRPTLLHGSKSYWSPVYTHKWTMHTSCKIVTGWYSIHYTCARMVYFSEHNIYIGTPIHLTALHMWITECVQLLKIPLTVKCTHKHKFV